MQRNLQIRSSADHCEEVSLNFKHWQRGRGAGVEAENEGTEKSDQELLS